MITKLQIIKRYVRSIFDLKSSQEDEIETYNEVQEGIYFKGKNLWLLAIAIIISCIGLNINSKTAVIGAMIISPLMGPVFGVGFALAISDTELLKLSFKNISIIVVISLFFSTLYYLINPYSIATDELLSFSKPTIFDVLLAFVGGIAGFIAISRHNGTQVLIGVAVATSCIPPLCTAGFGIATLQWQYLVGGLYTYIINALFICIGAYLVTKYLKFTPKSNTKVKNVNNWFGILVFITIIPAVYLAYDLATKNLYNNKAQHFISEVIQKKYHVVHHKIDVDNREITLDLLVEKYNAKINDSLKKQILKYNLKNTKLKIFQTVEAGKGNKKEFDLLKTEIDLLKNEINVLKEVNTRK